MKTWALVVTLGLSALILGAMVIHGMGALPMLGIEPVIKHETNEKTQEEGTRIEPVMEESSEEMQASYEEVSVIHGQLKLTMKVPPLITKGQPLYVTLELTNIGNGPITVKAISTQIFDFIVYKGDVKVYQWSSDKAFIQIIIEKTLQPGQSIIQTLSSRPVTFTEGPYTVIGGANVIYAFYEYPLRKFDQRKVFFIQTPPLQFEVI